MFTPYKIPWGGGRKTELKATKIIEGINDLGHKFVIDDNWSAQAHAGTILERPWLGRTSFVIYPEEEDFYPGGDHRR